MRHHRLFEGTGSIPAISRLLGLNDKLDITAGSFPLNIDERLQRQHLWVFQPYTDLRKSGGLIGANEAMLRDNLDATLARLSKFQMGEAEEVEPDERHEILYDGHIFKVINEIGGTDARRLLFNRGLTAYLSVIGSREVEGRRVSSYTVGRRSRYITAMPVGPELYRRLNEAEGAPEGSPLWGGSDIVGGCRQSLLPWERVRDVILAIIGRTSPLAA